MAEEGQRKGLGRGLAALIGEMENDIAALERARTQRRLPIEFLRANPRNPRKKFASEGLDELAASIREKGLVQPILVRPVADVADQFEIIAGERRWRAAQQVGLHEVPVLIHRVSDKEALELAIVENVQRSDLNPMEEALGYQQLIDEFEYSHADLAKVIGKSRPHVANMLRLLKLPNEVQDMVMAGDLSAGHARALVNAPEPLALAERAVKEGLSVRDVEALTSQPQQGGGDGTAPRRGPRAAAKSADTLALEKTLSDALGLTVTIAHRANGSGEVKIRYRSLEQLDEVCRRLQAG